LSNFPELLKPSEVTERDEKIESLKQELAENTRYYVARLNEAGATIGTFKNKLEAVQAKKQRLQNDLGNSQAEVIELQRVEFVEPLTEYPGTDNEKVGTPKCSGHALNLLNICTHQKTAAFN
jgi:hypothetical protein